METKETKRAGRPKGSKNKTQGQTKNTEISELRKMISTLNKKHEKLLIESAKAKDVPLTVYSLDPEYKRRIERDKLILHRRKTKVEDVWYEIVAGKIRKVTQLYSTNPDGTLRKGNLYRTYVGKADPKTTKRTAKTLQEFEPKTRKSQLRRAVAKEI